MQLSRKTCFAAFAAFAFLGTSALAQSTIPAPPDVASPPADAVKTPSGLATKVLTPGKGKEHPTKDDIVTSQRILDDHGLAVPHWPLEWGGRDWTPLQRHLWSEEMTRAHVPHPIVFNTAMVGPVIAAFGSQALKERFLPPTASAHIWWSQGFSEPNAGSDLA